MPKSLYIDPVKVREPGYIHFEDIPVCQYNKTIKQELDEGNYTKEDLIRIYRDMAICREFEHMLTLIKTQANYNGVETTYPGPAHLSYGQEASCVGEAYLLNKDDITFGSHRSHSEILSKGLSCINKLSDEELMQTMESFLGGKTLAAVKKFADTSDVKELPSASCSMAPSPRSLPVKTASITAWAAPCTRSSCRSASTRTTPSSAAPLRSQRALRCTRRITTRRASSSATSAMRPSAAARFTRP